jgi:hypothetical protein
MAQQQATEILAMHEAAAKAAGVASAYRQAAVSDIPYEAIIAAAEDSGADSDFHGVAWPQGYQRAAARLGNAEGSDALEDSGIWSIADQKSPG